MHVQIVSQNSFFDIIAKAFLVIARQVNCILQLYFTLFFSHHYKAFLNTARKLLTAFLQLYFL